MEGRLAGEQALLDEESVGGDKRDGAPRLFVEEAVSLAGSDLEVNGFRAEGFPFCMSRVPALLPCVHPEDNASVSHGLELTYRQVRESNATVRGVADLWPK